MAEMNVDCINPFLEAAIAIVRDACQIELKVGKPYVKPVEFTEDTVIILIGVTGQMRGQVILSMAVENACKAASLMMMGMPVDEFNDMAQSAISEMSNMLTANAATNLAGMGFEVDISTPSMTIGENFQIKISDDQYLTVGMDIGGHELEIDIAVSTQ